MRCIIGYSFSHFSISAFFCLSLLYNHFLAIFFIPDITYSPPLSPFRFWEIVIRHSHSRKIFPYFDNLLNKVGYYKLRKKHTYRLFLRDFLILDNKNSYPNFLTCFLYSAQCCSILGQTYFSVGSSIARLQPQQPER